MPLAPSITPGDNSRGDVSHYTSWWKKLSLSRVFIMGGRRFRGRFYHPGSLRYFFGRFSLCHYFLLPFAGVLFIFPAATHLVRSFWLWRLMCAGHRALRLQVAGAGKDGA